MKTIIIKSLEQYLNEIAGFSDVLFYRGVCNISYELIPSVCRFGIKDKKTQMEFEKSLLKDFIRKAPLYIERSPSNDLEWMILAQHHGIPTRLMDWSFNPLIASFFAVENEEGSDCAVYMSYLSSGLQNPKTFDLIFSEKTFTPTIPNFTQQRYANQESLFTLHSDPTKFDESKFRQNI